MLPHAHASWEESGTIDDVAEVAHTADRLGFHFLTCAEHVVVPVDVARPVGAATGILWPRSATWPP